ncbi:MAG: hypothetical protein QOF89_2166 [Acidobacteriota bacterium]|jgi:hypothetical protein|nr:hypothetical protein [Acidobacteriota bacterium]
MRGRILIVLILCLLLVPCVACQSPDEKPGVWFVHATDPHLFEEPAKPDDKDFKEKEEIRKVQEDLNEKAFRAMLGTFGSLPGVGVKPDFLVVTGDFGVGEREPADSGTQTVPPSPSPTPAPAPSGVPAPAPAAQPPKAQAARIERLAQILGASPVRDLYFVPGNNDIRDESADAESLTEERAFFDEVQKKLGGKVVLHDLTGCYLAGPVSQCWADVPGTTFRLVGFPSYSFKNRKPKPDEPAPDPAKAVEKRRIQEQQMETFAGLVQQAAAAGKRVLVLTHIAELDDPFTRAQEESTGAKLYAKGDPDRPSWSAWDVSPAVFTKWKDVINGGTVTGVLAGHFHDSHRETYRPPYRWARRSLDRADLGKLFLAPPLAVRKQDTSPFQARGFALVHLTGDRMTHRLYWFDQASSSFTPDPERRRPSEGMASRAVSGLWQVGTDKENLARAALVAIALIAALLTAIATWEIPPSTTKPALPVASPPPTGNSAPDSSASAGKKDSSFLPFQGNFARTVIGGLGGMAAVSFVEDSYWKDAGVSPKAHYLVLFVAFFLIILVTSSVYQGAVEALRSRMVLRQASAWSGRRRGESKLAQSFLYWGRRFWRWVLSLRSSALIFLDTVFNVIQGKNQTHTAVFGEEIRNLHWSLVWAADRLREDLDQKILAILNSPEVKPFLDSQKVKSPKDEDIRVNIGVLSTDWSSVSYVSWERGSLGKPFDQHSVAWISIYAGIARWSKTGPCLNANHALWKDVYAANSQRVVLYDNGRGDVPGEPAEVLLSTHYQDRPSSDYEAFVVLPVPWSRRGEVLDYQRAGILISFRKAAYMDALWEGLEQTVKDDKKSWKAPNYGAWKGLLRLNKEETLHIKSPELHAVLRQAVDVLGELFRYFNPTVFEEQIRPHLKS